MEEEREEGREEGILKVTSNSLILAYVIVKLYSHNKFTILPSWSKILWAAKCHEVGGLPRKFESYTLGEASS